MMRTPVLLANVGLASLLALGAAGALTPPAAAGPARQAASQDGAPAPEPLSKAEVAQAEAFRDKLARWADDMDRVLPRLTEDAEPDQSAVMTVLAADIQVLLPHELLDLEAKMSHHPGFWELPNFVYAILEPDAPVPPFYADQLVLWAAKGEIDEGEAARLLSRPIGVARPPALEPPAGVRPGPIGASPSGAAAPDAIRTPNPTATVPYPTMPLFPPRSDLPALPDSRTGCPGIFKGNTCTDCPGRVPLAAIFAIDSAALIAERVTDSLNPDIETTVCPPPGGVPVTTTALPNPAYYIANAIRIALEATVRGLEFANELSLECEHNLHKGILDLFLDTTVSSRVTQASFDAHAMLMMQIEIENNLLRQADDRIGLFQMPQGTCSVLPVPDDTATMTGFEGFRFCGRLELVRDIVADTIDRAASSDMLVDIAGARAELAAGDMHYMNDQWKSAYERYSTAYRAAVQEESRR